MHIEWSGYEFYVRSHTDTMPDQPGVYIFTGRNPHGQWVPYYVGQTTSLLDRIPNHEQWDAAVRLGATHVHTLLIRTEKTRKIIEADVIKTARPTLNK